MHTTIENTGRAAAQKPQGTRKERARLFVRVFFARRLVRVAFAMIVLVILMALLANCLPYGWNENNVKERLSPPSWRHPFGTDRLGRDTLARVLYGARVSLIVSVVSTLLAGSVGMLVGMLAGYMGKLADTVIMRVLDAMMTLPMIILAIFLASVMGGGLVNVCVCIGIAMVPSYARLTRSQVLQIRQLDYVTAGMITGSGKLKNAFTHILPNCLPGNIVLMTMNLGTAIMVEAGLSYLGVGITPPTPSWGYLVNYGREWLSTKPYMCIIPGLFIIGTTWAFNVCGDALRDALDPKLRGRL